MRPREKLGQTGLHPLSDQELLALVLGHGVRGRDALALSADILRGAGGIHGLARSTADQLAIETGLGPATAARLVAAIEMGRRTLQRQPEPRMKVTSPRELAGYLMPLYGSAHVERFGVVLVDTKHQLIRVRILAVGSSDSMWIRLNCRVPRPGCARLASDRRCSSRVEKPLQHFQRCSRKNNWLAWT